MTVIRRKPNRKGPNKMKFIGREQELKRLSGEISALGFRAVLIYGRRRIGKSELVKKAISDGMIPAIYYECRQVAEESNVEGIGKVLSEKYSLPVLGYRKADEILEYIFRMSEKNSVILVLDEYPYLRENVKGMDSILQTLIDKYRDTSHMKLILLGSYVSVMKSLLEKNNPLYGRIDLPVELKQMDYFDSAGFYPNYSDEDKVRIYSVFGGVPYYNRLVDDRISVKENIIGLVASEGARLENEVQIYLQSEIAKMANANEVFTALANGYTKFSDILSQSHVSSGPTLIDILNKLIKMEVVEKTAPINDPGNRKKASYSVCDNLSLFYYRYIFSHASQLGFMDAEMFYDRYIAEDFETRYVPKRFEIIARQYLIRENRSGRIDPPFENIGKYYYDDPKSRMNGEFDVVTTDENGYCFYEVKFRKAPVSEKMIAQEITQVQATGMNCYRYAFISRSGFEAEESEQIRHISLREMYDH